MKTHMSNTFWPNNMGVTFTIEQGIEIQQKHLEFWKKILKPEEYDKLENHVKEVNTWPMNSGLDVFRGSSIDVWIKNNLGK